MQHESTKKSLEWKASCKPAFMMMHGVCVQNCDKCGSLHQGCKESVVQKRDFLCENLIMLKGETLPKKKKKFCGRKHLMERNVA